LKEITIELRELKLKFQRKDKWADQKKTNGPSNGGWKRGRKEMEGNRQGKTVEKVKLIDGFLTTDP
jgi:hypothetical protein